ncbi:NADH-quinone oxidoreductase subunit N 2 [uncultured Desulfovibrio sp.]|uniref:NADH-quinone oxidoreductase subunit N n=1 Tax=uncultured Desulfovibrio sp. TaxID=167968 RepID=A0A212KKX6_9BACT|nr:NADH-quinone oxidoreductase subunit N [Desulfovibrio desulfuricans]MCB6541859.1 NADH-quinone oxidoreductase subunit N [Desulfovibrio desulfuricans]MCB6552875.1 NADH-quinone oxidoreductase subunit N [Desulfovibrio desulfuricans]MCB6564718.1 NADH-quinone oxidoreductase subunit N [Desulfovibrio desulfuricans]MCB7345965.1 NADH-quinone oxidoreductase subunit N [Desulfovibrio desulfuricans]MCQ4859802.1 NADH-quinone oxidoreductase subunit N [Desulfovibrio desulfuricans]
MNAHLFAPELVLLAGCLLAFCMTLTEARTQTLRLLVLCVGAAFAATSVLCLFAKGTLFYGAYRVDLFSQLVKCVMSIGFTLMLLFGADTKGISVRMRPEYYFFLLTSLLGLTLLSSSVELITLFIALELSSYSLYLLVPMRTPSDSMRAPMEAAIKYLLFGVTASGIMLFGMSWIFGIAGSTYLDQILPAMRTAGSHAAPLVGLLMLFCGMFFKLAVFPFHFWAPDVYQGASNDTTAFIASIPKIVAVAVLARFCAMAYPGEGHVALLLTGLSIASMCYGNLTALVQTDVKRMLGFSGIAHAGYILMGMATLQGWGIATALYYATGYLFMMLAAFLVLCVVSPDGRNLSIKDLNGLSRRSPLLAFVLGVSMFALAGIPPFVGFMGKFMLLTGAWRAGHTALVIIAAINTAIGIYYYLQVVRAVYTEAALHDAEPIVPHAGARMAGICLVGLVLALGIAPESMLQLAREAVQAAW